MKKKIITILVSLFLGGSMGFLTIHKFNFENTTYKFSAFQLGVYKSYDNALEKAKTANGAIIISKENGYEVIGAIAHSDASKAKLKELLVKDNLEYYQKDIILNEKVKETVDEYELLINATDDYVVLEKLNEQLLKNIEERMN